MARVTRLGPGVFRVDEDAAGHGKQALVYVAGARGKTWAFSNGRVYRPVAPEEPSRRVHLPGAVQSLTSPMPATVVKVLAVAGQAVKAGDTLVIVEAMKMELPVRAPADAIVKAVLCKEKELVQADQILVELE